MVISFALSLNSTFNFSISEETDDIRTNFELLKVFLNMASFSSLNESKLTSIFFLLISLIFDINFFTFFVLVKRSSGLISGLVISLDSSKNLEFINLS